MYKKDSYDKHRKNNIEKINYLSVKKLFVRFYQNFVDRVYAFCNRNSFLAGDHIFFF